MRGLTSQRKNNEIRFFTTDDLFRREVSCPHRGIFAFLKSPFTPTLIFDIDLKEFATIAAM